MFSGLEEATEYVVTVRAATAEGEGPWSARMTINTTREMVRAPMGVKAVATSDQSIQVWWEAVPVRVKINGYRVYYTMTAVEDLNQWNVKDVPATESTDLANLEKIAQYAIAVAARTDNVSGTGRERVFRVFANRPSGRRRYIRVLRAGFRETVGEDHRGRETGRGAVELARVGREHAQHDAVVVAADQTQPDRLQDLVQRGEGVPGLAGRDATANGTGAGHRTRQARAVQHDRRTVAVHQLRGERERRAVGPQLPAAVQDYRYHANGRPATDGQARLFRRRQHAKNTRE